MVDSSYEESSGSDPEEYQDFSEQHQNKNLYECIIQTWRSLESNLKSSRENPQPVQAQIFELSSQIKQLMENQQKFELIREEEETQSKCKVLELINNLEAKHLKISEQNKLLLQEVLQGTNLGLTQTMFYPGKTLLGGTVAFLNTLNQIVKEEENENEKFLEEQLDIKEKEAFEKDQIISELRFEIETLNQQHEFKIKELDLELKHCKQENQCLQSSLNKLLSRQSQSITNQTHVDIEYALRDFTYDNILDKDKKLNIEILPSANNNRTLMQLEQIMMNLRKEPRIRIQPKESTIELFKQQLRRNSSFDQNTTKQRFIEEPTPRFILEKQQDNLNMTNPDQSYRNLTQNSVFQNNLSLNRSLVHNNSRMFNSTLNNVFRKRPTQNDQQKELWNYIFDLENELIEIQNKAKYLNDASQLEISLCLGNNEAVKNIKANLQSQIEDLAQENLIKTQKLVQLESFNNKLMKTLHSTRKGDPIEDDNSSLMLNLKGILSPNQYKKIKKFIYEDNCDLQNEDEAQVDNNNSLMDQDINISVLDNEQMCQMMKDSRAMNQDSKNSTLSFRNNGLNIESGFNDPNISQAMISPVYNLRQFSKGSFANKPPKRPINNPQLMLIQDQLNQSGYDSMDRSEEQLFFNQPSGIIENYQSLNDQSQFLNTQNNKTLQSFLNLNQSRVTESTNGGVKPNGMFGFKRNNLQKQNLMNQSKSFNNGSFQGGQTGQIIQHMHDNFQTQLQDLKDEKVKLIQILNKFLNLPNDTSTTSLEDVLQNTSHDNSNFIPSKQYFEDFRMQLTQALSKHQLDMTSVQDEQDKLKQERDKLRQQQERMERKRMQFNEKVKKLQEKNEDIFKKVSLSDEREKLLEQEEQKLKYRKQALDEEWKRLDKKREDLKQQEEIIHKEWEKLGKEVKEVNDMRIAQKEKKMEMKELKAKIDAEKMLNETQYEKIQEESQRLEEAIKKQKQNERKLEREQDKLNKMKDDMNRDKIEIEKQKEFIRQERSHIDQERTDLEQKRSLSGMFIPDLKNLVSKMSNKHKSLNRTYINDGVEESRVKQQYQSAMTNMNAYINKCQCNSGEGIFNCDLHKSMNKSTISLSNFCNYHTQQNQTISAIGSGRPTYKDQNPSSNQSSKISLQTLIQKEKSFKRPQGSSISGKNLNNTNMSFKFPNGNKKITVIDDEDCSNKENNPKLLNGLDSILKDTAKFKDTKNRLEQSYNSLIESYAIRVEGEDKDPMMNTQYSFMSFEDSNNGQTLSREEL